MAPEYSTFQQYSHNPYKYNVHGRYVIYDRNEDLLTPLQYAASKNKSKLCSYFLNAKDEYNLDFLASAYEWPSVYRPEERYDLVDEERKAKTFVGIRSAIHLAAFNGHTDCLRLLLRAGFNPSIVSCDNGYTPLHWAISLNHTECVRELLKAGADLRIKNKNGMSALDYAIHFNPKNSVIHEIIKQYMAYMRRRTGILVSTVGRDKHGGNDTIFRRLYERVPYSWREVIEYL